MITDRKLIDALKTAQNEIAHGAMHLPPTEEGAHRREYEAGKYAGVAMALAIIEGLLTGEDSHGHQRREDARSRI